jgi:hypothetical protein
VIAATASEALHVLDGLLYHQSDVTVCRHHTDGGGDAEHVFALLALLGFQFAPRIPDLKSRRLYSFATASAYPTLAPLIAGRINVALIRTHWAEILRVVCLAHHLCHQRLRRARPGLVERAAGGSMSPFLATQVEPGARLCEPLKLPVESAQFFNLLGELGAPGCAAGDPARRPDLAARRPGLSDQAAFFRFSESSAGGSSTCSSKSIGETLRPLRECSQDGGQHCMRVRAEKLNIQRARVLEFNFLD